jgi:L-threonylcarbamoyladenylate synthase
MKSGHNIRTIDALHPDPDLIAAACRVIQSGGIVAFPTSFLYGLAADAFNRSAVEKVRRMKNRPGHKPILLLVRHRDEVASLVADIPPQAVQLMDRFWPGTVTLVFVAAGAIPGHLTSGSGKIGVRVPAHPVARALVNGLEKPITGTSANLSGQPGVDSATGLHETLVEPPDLILDAGKLKGGKGSTVVDVSVFPPLILREGAVPARAIFSALNQ